MNKKDRVIIMKAAKQIHRDADALMFSFTEGTVKDRYTDLLFYSRRIKGNLETLFTVATDIDGRTYTK